jgi:hypothetical protein
MSKPKITPIEGVQLSLFDRPLPSPAAPQVGIFAIGDTVEIQAKGLFYGKRAKVLQINGNILTVKADTWAIEHTYHCKALKLVRKDG